MDVSGVVPRRSAGADATQTIVERQDDLYRKAGKEFGPAMARLAASYEADASLRQDLLQNIHVAVWQSLASFKGDCTLRTWVYRVAHNTAATHVHREKHVRREQWVSLEELDDAPDAFDAERIVDSSAVFERLRPVLDVLKPIDRDVFVLYLEGFEAAEIAAIIGISPNLAAQKVHRTKRVLRRRFFSGEDHAG